MNRNWKQAAVLLMTAIFSAGLVYAGASDLAGQADKVVRTAERNMHNGKNAEADRLLQEAALILEQAKAEDPADKKILRVEKNYNRVRKNVDRKLAQSAQRNTSSAQPVAKEESTSAGKLPGGVNKRLQDISRHLDQAERYAGRDARKAGYKLGQAGDLFDEIDNMYAGQFDKSNPEYAAVAGRYAELAGAASAQGAAEATQKADAQAAETEKNRQSEEWAARFRAYLSYPGQEGHNPDLLVYVPGTSEPEKFADAQRRYEAFKAFYAEYQKTEFPYGKTWQLESLGDSEAPRRIQQFEEDFASRIDSVAGDAERQIDTAMAQLDQDNGWRSDKSVKPNLVDHKWLESIRESVVKTNTALGPDNPEARAVQAKFDALLAKDQEHRQVRMERTFMTPDKYQGGDAGELKAKAESLVEQNKSEGGQPLRCTLVSESWREESVREWTDTSRTTWRHRTTRHLTAQVATKNEDGVRLITVALAQDKQSDGSWGALYGNLHQYPNPMLESNVFKNPG